MCFTFFITATTLAMKKTQQTYDFMATSINTMPLESFVCGCIAGVAGRAAVLPLDTEKQLPLSAMVKGRKLSDAGHAARVLYRYTPYWGLRMAIYANSTQHYGTLHHDANPVMMAPYFALTGAWTEMWTRVVLNPFNKVRYTRDLLSAKSGTDASIPQALSHLWGKSGALSIVQDAAKYRAELPKMGAVFGVYHTLRNTLLSAASGDVSQAGVAIKLPVDLLCGAAGGAAGGVVSHAINTAIYDSTSPYAMAGRSVQQAVMLEAPIAAIAFGGYGLMMHFLGGPYPDGGLSGWEAVEAEVTEYGAEIRSS